MQNPTQPTAAQPILVIAASGKTGRRVADALEARQIPVRRGSRSGDASRGTVRFDWNDRSSWRPALEGARAAYVVYSPDLAVPEAPDAIQAFTELAVELGVERLVILSGRGEEEAQRSEQIVADSGLEWTVVRASWFNQNFDEGEFRDLVLSGAITVPVGEVREPFIDIQDIADVAVAALTEDGHSGEIYEVTGPRLMTFADVASELAEAAGRRIEFVRIPREAFTEGLEQAGLERGKVELLDYLFTTVLDGRNESLTDGVQRALGRAPRDFSDYAREVAATGVWNDAPALA